MKFSKSIRKLCKPSGGRLVGTFITQLFNNLENDKIDYCILRNYETLPNYPSYDLDILLTHNGLRHIERTLKRLIKQTPWRPYARKYHANHSVDYFLCYVGQSNQLLTLNLEFMSKYVIHTRGLFRNIELCAIPTELIMANRRCYKEFWVPSESIEVVHLFLELCLVGKDKYWYKLFKKFNRNRKLVANLLVKLYGEKMGNYILKVLDIGSFNTIKSLRLELLSYLVKYNKFTFYERFIHDITAILKRLKTILQPQGILVIFLGPDGTGKTTIADLTAHYFKRRYPLITRKHLANRPIILPSRYRQCLKYELNSSKFNQTLTLNERLYKDPSYYKSVIYSTIRIFWHLLDHIFDFYLRLRRYCVKGALVICERYAYDYWAAFEKHAPKAPEWARKLIYKFAPSPDIVIYLDTEAEEIFKRKQELSIEMIRSQINRYRFLVTTEKRVYQVNNNVTPETVLFHVAKIIIDYSMKRFLRNY